LDVSHNLAGIKHTIDSLGELINKDNLHILIGLVEDKDYQKIARLIANHSNRIVVTEPETHRKLSAEVLVGAFNTIRKKAILIKDLNQAYEFSKKQLHGDDNLLVIGSHYLVGPLMNKGK
jgi:dihydrofolate synthase/folylpolyglutamate synthase